jgi:general secretion pathway protein K
VRRAAFWPARADRGMVLVAVLWMVAALTVVVTGITRSVREEARVSALSRQSVEAGALGDAAIHLVLQDMAMQTSPVARLTQLHVPYRGVQVEVQIMPLNGLIDINNAPAELLAALYVQAGGLGAPAAAALAQATVETRSRKDARGLPERFEAPEDLLRVPGVAYDLYAKIADLVTADLRSGGKVNPLAAPASVLAVLANGNAAVASRIASARDAGQEGIDTTALDAGLTDNLSVRRYRIQARLPLPDGMWLRVSRSVELDVRGRGGLPWYTFHTQRGFEPSPRKSS